MKSILVSIKPKWVSKILNGEKTIEIRKTAPKCQLPIDVYIYCTDGKAVWKSKKWKPPYRYVKPFEEVRGCVCAKFTLKEVERIYRVGAWDEDPCVDAFATNKMNYDELLNKSCLKETEMDEYLTSDKEFVGYAYHISDLQIFDKPMELSDFKYVKKYHGCVGCQHLFADDIDVCLNGCTELMPVKRTPQSWCYVEVKE